MGPPFHRQHGLKVAQAFHHQVDVCSGFKLPGPNSLRRQPRMPLAPPDKNECSKGKDTVFAPTPAHPA